MLQVRCYIHIHWGDELQIMFKDTCLACLPQSGNKLFFGPNGQGTYLEEDVDGNYPVWLREHDCYAYIALAKRDYKGPDHMYTDESLAYWVHFMEGFGFLPLVGKDHPWG